MNKKPIIVAALAALGLGQLAFAQSRAVLPDIEVPSVVQRSTYLGHVDPNMQLHVTVSLPFGNQGAAEAFADSVSDPASPNYRNFITPREVGQQFGLSDTQVQGVVDYLKGNGFKIKLIADNRLAVTADCTVGQAERAFGTSIGEFRVNDAREPGNPHYFSFVSAISVPSTIAQYVQNVSGLENFTQPKPLILNPTQTRSLYSLATMYNAGNQGQGRTVAISNFDGYRLSNVPLYYSQFGLPTPTGGVGSNITVKTISGGAGSGTPQGEGDLDIQMALGMAPLSNLIIYDAGASDLIGCLTAEVNDNLADVITESYGWSLSSSTATSAHNLHVSMTSQGITYMAASGDSGTSLEPYSYPDYEPEVLSVGGTIATVDSSGNRTSEVGWSLSGGNGGGGGWSTTSISFNTLPSWQKGNGVPTTINFRLVPDVALNAAGTSGAYYFYLNGALTTGYVGTSFASPVFAGSLAVAEQNIISQGGLPANGAGKRRFGRIQNLLYSQNGRSDVWFDITSGSNGTLPNGQTSNAGPGWDFVSGWGAINWAGFVASQVTATIPAAPTNLTAAAGNAKVSLSWTASTGATSYNVKRATVSGGPYTTIGSPTTTSFTDSTVTNGTTYFYVATAVNSAGESGNSNQVSATPNLSIPAAPTGLKATAGNAQVALSWTASTNATSYHVKRATVSGGPYTTIASPTTTSYTDTAVTNGTTYYYVVSALDSAGESANSSQVSATPNAVVAQQLMLNPGFESGSASWTATAAVIGQNGPYEPAHSGTWDAWLCGYGTTHTDTIWQQVSIPSNINTATLSFYMHIDTSETTTTTAYDTVKIQIQNSSGTLLATLATYSNLNKASGYTQKSFDLTAYKGQTIRVYVIGSEDSSLQTSFVFDDFALNTQ